MTGPARREVLVGAAAVTAAVAGLAACAKDDAPAAGTKQVTVPAAKVPVGGGYVDKDAGVVITQPKAGEFHAFASRCPHAGCQVTEVAKGRIVCPCHSSLFADGTGEVVGGPAKSGLTSVPVRTSGSDVVAGG